MSERQRQRRANSNDRKKEKGRLILLVVLGAVFAVIFVIAVYFLLTELLEYKKGNDAYALLQNSIVEFNDNDSKTDSSNEDSAGNGEIPISVDFDTLSAENPDMISWIFSEGTPINYPIMHGTDNSYYLRHLPDGTLNKNGSIFIDYRNSGDLSDKNTLIYGHHMHSGAMFASLVNYAKTSYYEEHPYFHIIMPDAIYRAEIFSAYTAPAASENLFRFNFEDDTDFEIYLQMVEGMSDIASGVEVSTSDRIVTLVTCTYAFDEARYLVHAKLVKVGD